MVRSGRFGRLPRQAPDLSGAIAALLREMQAQEDQNYIDAWKNGGEVDGKPVNDARLLAHFRARRNSLSKDDPLWDEWDNRLTQYTFAIEESKMSLKWDQKKVSESQMAAFYSRWAKKATKNSEFRRTLESSAARWRASANQRSGSGSGGSSADAHYEWASAYYKRHVAPGDLLLDGLVKIGMTYQAISSEGYSAPTLDNINPNAPGYSDFLDVYYDGKVSDPVVQSLIESLTEEVRKDVPDFKFDKQHIDALLDRAQDGTATLVRRSTSKTEREQWQEIRGDFRTGRLRLREAPAVLRIFEAGQQWIEEDDNCFGDPSCRRRVAADLRTKLMKEQARLTEAGIKDVDLSVTPAVAGTIEMLDRALLNGDIDPADPNRKGTIFDLAQMGEENQLGQALSQWRTDEDNLRGGGWLATMPLTGADGLPLLDDDGDRLYYVTVQRGDTLVPADFLEVPANGMVESLPEGARAYVQPVPVTVQFVNPDGTPVSNEIVNKVVRGEGGAETVVQPGSQMDWVLTREYPGIVYDGKAYSAYRTGSGTADDPYLYHTREPLVLGQDGRPLTKRGFAGPGGTELPAYTVVVEEDPAAFEGKGGYKADVSAFVQARNEQRTVLTSGELPIGSYRTLEAASTARAIDGLYDSRVPDANEQATELMGQLDALATRAAVSGDTALNALLREDIAKVQTVVRQRSRGETGDTISEDFAEANRWPEERLSLVQQMQARGITDPDDIAMRLKAADMVDDWEERFPSRELESRLRGMELYSGPGTAPGWMRETKSQRMARITNPFLSAEQVLTLPSWKPEQALPAPAQIRTVADISSVGGLLATPPKAAVPIDTVNGPAPGVPPPAADRLGELSTLGSAALPKPKPPKPQPQEKPKRNTRMPARASWSGGTKVLADSTKGTWYDPTTGSVHTPVQSGSGPLSIGRAV